MYYIGYYQKSAISELLVSACGDRAIVILDGRDTLDKMIQDARDFNGVHRPVYKAFKIHKGDNVLRSNPITKLILL